MAKTNGVTDTFVRFWNTVAYDIHCNAVNKGWWETDRNDAECIMLMVTELAEACEALREGNPPDDKLPEFDGLVVELADTVIRIMDYTQARDLPIADAIIAKMQYNKTRPRKHGKEF